MKIYEKIEACTKQIEARLPKLPKVGIVLGSGLGKFADTIENPTIIPYDEIDGFPTSTAPGHHGRFVYGEVEGIPVILMQGRIHLYEGYPIEDCVLPIRVMGKLGIEVLILTNAAGACNPEFEIGDFCVLKDHLSVLVPSPLIGPNDQNIGTRFPDMTEVYAFDLRTVLYKSAKDSGANVHDGIYLQFTGPQYETPAEIRLAQGFGADLVGMSTVIEAIAAHHMNIPKIGAVSLVTNKAAGMGDTELNEQEVIEAGEKASATFQEIIKKAILNCSSNGFFN